MTLPMMDDEYFDEAQHQGKIIKVGDIVTVQQAGVEKSVTVSSILKKQNHYWVGYDNNAHFCPWPLVKPKK